MDSVARETARPGGDGEGAQRLRALVTGAGRGIGRAIARRLGEEGALVACSARSEHELERVAREVDDAGGRGKAIPMDVADFASVEEGVHQALEFTGGVFDIVVNNAGVFSIHAFDEMSPATWYRTLAVNLNGPYHVTLMSLRGLELSARAHLFNVSSIAGRQAFEGNAAYCASKYALRGLSDVLRIEWAERGIRVSTIYPGGTDTTIFDDVPGNWDRTTMNQPEDVADVLWAAYLAPDDADVADLDVPNPRLA